MALMEEDNRRKPPSMFRNLNAKIAALPMIATVLVVFVGCTLWTVVYSFTSSKSLPMLNFVGFDQYTRLFSATRWHVSIRNLAIYGVFCMGFSLVTGFILAALMDQKIRFENTFRTIFLYPYALSFIVTGLVWQWIFNPQLGLEKVIRDIGFDNFQMAILSSRTYVIYAIVIAGLWQMTGLVMVLMLAGLRNVDDEIWKAARVDGIPKWKTYLFIILPMMRPVLVTTVVLIATGIVKLYDLVVAMTNGGPGIASEVPAKYVYDFMFGWANLGQGLAASTIMLTTVLIILVPWTMLEYSRRKAR
ncbi:carbohydrate ABC transporter permease [Brucella tritici]|uniref:carbohydrate ABC transporter permease n=1 Tax=Brucella tritici TaxID=94626 RepID=UPI0015924FD9|nr:sugar ABC transporter permease [Brucella tritici]